jgi:hypothetical protein
MNEVLPTELQKKLREPMSSEEAEDLRLLLEAVVENQAIIIEMLDNWAKAPVQNVKVTGAAAFWESAFSFWGFLALVLICATLTQIFAGTPLFK